MRFELGLFDCSLDHLQKVTIIRNGVKKNDNISCFYCDRWHILFQASIIVAPSTAWIKWNVWPNGTTEKQTFWCSIDKFGVCEYGQNTLPNIHHIKCVTNIFSILLPFLTYRVLFAVFGIHRQTFILLFSFMFRLSTFFLQSDTKIEVICYWQPGCFQYQDFIGFDWISCVCTKSKKINRCMLN